MNQNLTVCFVLRKTLNIMIDANLCYDEKKLLCSSIYTLPHTKGLMPP
jgi:hypothetical protein